MNIMRYDAFREIRTLQNEMNRLFTGATAREDFLDGEWMPKVDVFENADSFVLEAELPGMSREEFDLSFENNVLTLKGERKFEKKEEGDNYHRIERGYGTFARSFTLPQTVTAEGANAEFENGVLRVSLPRREETKARKIEVTSGDTGAKTIEAAKTASP